MCLKQGLSSMATLGYAAKQNLGLDQKQVGQFQSVAPCRFETTDFLIREAYLT